MERQLVELLRGLRARGHVRTAVATFTGGGQFEPSVSACTVEPVRVIRRGRIDVSPMIPLLPWASRVGIGLVHTFGWMSGLAGWTIARALRVPLVNGGIRAAPPRLSVREWFQRWTLRHADAIVSNSNAGLLAYGVAQDPRARVIFNGIDLSRFEPASVESHGPNMLCMVANFSSFKDHATVIRALSLIRSQVPTATLTLVGRDCGTLQACRGLIDELDLQDGVRMVHDCAEPHPYVRASRVCLLASNPLTHGEGISNAVLEYMALAKPVVATDTGGNDEVITDGETGFLVPAASPAAIADRVCALLSSPQVARTLGQAGRGRVIEDFSLDAMIDSYDDLYANLLN